MSTQWETDINQLNGDIGTWQTEQSDYSTAVEDYHTAFQRMEHTSDAMVAFTMLAWLMAQQGCDQLNLQTAGDGGALKIQGDLTKLGNDIEKETKQDADDKGASIHDVAAQSEQLYQLLTTTTDPNGLALQKALGSDASSALASQYLIIRDQIDDSSVAGNPTGGWYFIAPGTTPPSGSDLITSYAQFQTDLATQGDPQSANEALKQQTDSFNENTSTTQSTNAASQEIISNDTNMTKAVQAFITDMFHAIMDVISAANKASARAS